MATLFKLRNVSFRVHFTLMLGALYFGFVAYAQLEVLAYFIDIDATEMLLPAWAWGGLIAASLPLCVAWHELGHVLIARQMGRRVTSMELFMLGGLSKVEGGTSGREASRDQGVAAVGGCLTSALTAIFLFGAAYFAPVQNDLRFGLFYCAQLHMFVAVANLLPAYPLDGGQVLRSLLCRRFSPSRGLQVALAVGQTIAVGCLIFGGLTVSAAFFLLGLSILLICRRERRFVSTVLSEGVLQSGSLGRPTDRAA